jgi:cytochrome c biogenesis factor
VAILALGIALSSNLGIEDEVTLTAGESVEFGAFEITYAGPFNRVENNRDVIGALVEVRRGGDLVTVQEPRLNRYFSTGQTVATPSVDTQLGGDLYLSLVAIGDNGASLDLFWFPFIWLMWVGGALTAGGGVWAWLVRKPRREVDVAATPKVVVTDD